MRLITVVDDCYRLIHVFKCRYATSTNMSKDAFGEEVLVYANLNNWGGRFFVPGVSDSSSLVYFDWLEYGRLNGATLLWTEDW